MASAYKDFALWAGIVFLLASPGLLRRRTVWLVFAVATASLLDDFATILPSVDHQFRLVNGYWNWTGKLYSVIAMSAFAAALVASRTFSRKDIALTFQQLPGALRAATMVAVPYFVILATLTVFFFGNRHAASVETLLYQATMPGLAEELSVRGIQFALFDRILAFRFRLGGATLGYGAIATSIAFGAGHAISLDQPFEWSSSLMLFGVTGSIGFLLCWLRARTGSLAVPVIVHNITNLILEGVPRLF